MYFHKRQIALELFSILYSISSFLTKLRPLISVWMVTLEIFFHFFFLIHLVLMKDTWRVFLKSLIHIRSKFHGIKHMAYRSPQSFCLLPMGDTAHLLDNMEATESWPVTCSEKHSLSDHRWAAMLTSHQSKISDSSSHFWTGMKPHNEGVGCSISIHESNQDME